MTAGMQIVLILQQRAVSDQHLAVRNPPPSQEVLHLENSPSLSKDFYFSRRSTTAKKTTIPKSRIPTKPGNPENGGNSKISKFWKSLFQLCQVGLDGEESWQCAQPLPVEDDSLTVFIRKVLYSLCTTNTWAAYTGATSRLPSRTRLLQKVGRTKENCCSDGGSE